MVTTRAARAAAIQQSGSQPRAAPSAASAGQDKLTEASGSKHPPSLRASPSTPTEPHEPAATSSPNSACRNGVTQHPGTGTPGTASQCPDEAAPKLEYDHASRTDPGHAVAIATATTAAPGSVPASGAVGAAGTAGASAAVSTPGPDIALTESAFQRSESRRLPFSRNAPTAPLSARVASRSRLGEPAGTARNSQTTRSTPSSRAIGSNRRTDSSRAPRSRTASTCTTNSTSNAPTATRPATNRTTAATLNHDRHLTPTQAANPAASTSALRPTEVAASRTKGAPKRTVGSATSSRIGQRSQATPVTSSAKRDTTTRQPSAPNLSNDIFSVGKAVAEDIKSLNCSPQNTTAPILVLLGFTSSHGDEPRLHRPPLLQPPAGQPPKFTNGLTDVQRLWFSGTVINNVGKALSTAMNTSSPATRAKPIPPPRAARTLTNSLGPETLPKEISSKVPVLIDAFKISLQFLLVYRSLHPDVAPAWYDTPNLEITMCTLISKLHVLGLTTHVLRESTIFYHMLLQGNVSLAIEVPSLTATLTPAELVHDGGDELIFAEILALNVHVSALAAVAALKTPTTEQELSRLTNAWRNEKVGPRALQLQARTFWESHRPTSAAQEGSQGAELENTDKISQRWTKARDSLDRSLRELVVGTEHAIERLSKTGCVVKTGLSVLDLRQEVLALRLCQHGLDQPKFWSGVGRTATLWAQGYASMVDVDPEEAYKKAHTMVSALAHLGRQGGQLTSDLQSWGQLWELWIRIAQKTGSKESLEVIEELSSVSVDPSTDQMHAKPKAEIGAVLARLERALGPLDKWVRSVHSSNEDTHPDHETIAEALALASSTTGLLFAEDDQLGQDMVDKTLRAVDRLRRRTIFLLVHLFKDPSARPWYLTKVSALSMSLLKASRKAICAGLSSDGSMLTDMFDLAFRVYQAHSTCLDDSMSSDDVLAFVQTCERICKQCGLVLRSLSNGTDAQSKPSERLMELECLLDLSRMMFYPGYKLFYRAFYSDALPFLRGSCEMGRQARELAQDLEKQGEGSTKRVSPRMLQKLADLQGENNCATCLSRRHDALAVCYRRLSDPRKAVESYAESLRLTPSQTWAQLSSCAGAMPLNAVFADSRFSSLATLARTIIEVGTCDLLSFQDASSSLSLAAILKTEERGDAPYQEASSALLEHAGMAILPMSSKTLYAQACSSLLKEAATRLDSHHYPARLARIMLIQAELALMVRDQQSLRGLLADATPLLQAAMSGAPTKESGLAPFAPAAMARRDLLAIIGMVNLQDDVNGQLWQRVQRVARALEPLLKPSTSSSNSRADPTAAPITSSAPLQPVQMTTPRKPRRVAVPPRPREKASTLTEPQPLASTDTIDESEPLLTKIDHPHRLVTMLEAATETARASGHTLAALKLLQLVSSLHRLLDTVAERRTPSEQVLRSEIEMAREHLLLGLRPDTDLLKTVMRNVSPACSAVTMQTHLLNAEVLMLRAQGSGRKTQDESLRAAIKAFDIALAASQDIVVSSNTRLTSWERMIHKLLNQEVVLVAAETLATVAAEAGNLGVALTASMVAFKNTMAAAQMLKSYARWTGDAAAAYDPLAAPRTDNKPQINSNPSLSANNNPNAGFTTRNAQLIEPLTVSTEAFTDQTLASPVTLEFLGSYWRSVRHLLGISMLTARLYTYFGAGKDSLLWAEQAQALSQFLSKQSYTFSAAAALHGEVAVLRSGQGLSELWKEKSTLSAFPSPWDVYLANFSLRNGSVLEAHQALEEYDRRLDTHTALFESLGHDPPPTSTMPSNEPLTVAAAVTKSAGQQSHPYRAGLLASPSQRIWPSFRGRLLRHRAALAHHDQSDVLTATSLHLLEQSQETDPSAESMYSSALLRAAWTFDQHISNLKQEPSLTPLSGAVVQLPPMLCIPGSSNITALRVPLSKLRSMAAPLEDIQSQLKVMLARQEGGTRSALQMRETLMLQALTLLAQSSLGSPCSTTGLVAGAPDARSSKGLANQPDQAQVKQVIAALASASSVFIDAEYLAAIRHKLYPTADLRGLGGKYWTSTMYPSLKETLLPDSQAATYTQNSTSNRLERAHLAARSESPTRSGPLKKGRGKPKLLFVDDDDTSSVSDDEEDLMLGRGRSGSVSGNPREYWSEVQEKLRHLVFGDAQSTTVLDEVCERLPDHWSVISICRHPYQEHLLISRVGGGVPSLVWEVPIDRISPQTFEAVLSELTSITTESNEQVRKMGSRYKDSQDGRRHFWMDRRKLEERLGGLLDVVENQWLGCLKSVFAPPRCLSADDQAKIQAGVQSVLRDIFSSSAQQRVKVDNALLDLFARLPDRSNEILEDMLRLFASAFHLAGTQVEPLDWRRGTKELSAALQEAWDAPITPGPAPHTFLLLDKHMHTLPWESLPVLRHQSVTRIPSLTFLRDRLRWAELQGIPRAPDGTYIMPSTKTYYLLNPSGDLKRSEERLGSWLQARPTWTGLIGQTPMPDTWLNQLESSDLVLYFGHGGGDQYLSNSSLIRRLPKCAVSMLWGCSSGCLYNQGEFDPTGLPHEYMIAGAPALLACLWDTTDKEVDNVAESLYLYVGLACEEELPGSRSKGAYVHVNAQRDSALFGKDSLPMALARARRHCRLPLMTGGAVVLHGLPVRFNHDDGTAANVAQVCPLPSIGDTEDSSL